MNSLIKEVSILSQGVPGITLSWNSHFKLVKDFENSPLKVNAINQSLLNNPQEVQHLFHDLMEHSAQVISNIRVVNLSTLSQLNLVSGGVLKQVCCPSCRGKVTFYFLFINRFIVLYIDTIAWLKKRQNIHLN